MPSDDIRHLEQQIAELRERLEHLAHDQEVQFTRIAQMQADIDVIRATWAKIEPPGTTEPYIGQERRKAARKKR